MKFLRDIFTEDDNQTYCAARVCAIAAVFGFLATALIHVIHGNSMDFAQLGVGCGAVLGGAGAFVGAKAITQKEA